MKTILLADRIIFKCRGKFLNVRFTRSSVCVVFPVENAEGEHKNLLFFCGPQCKPRPRMQCTDILYLLTL